jgi:hypothetical protein
MRIRNFCAERGEFRLKRLIMLLLRPDEPQRFRSACSISFRYSGIFIGKP